MLAVSLYPATSACIIWRYEYGGHVIFKPHDISVKLRFSVIRLPAGTVTIWCNSDQALKAMVNPMIEKTETYSERTLFLQINDQLLGSILLRETMGNNEINHQIALQQTSN